LQKIQVGYFQIFCSDAELPIIFVVLMKKQNTILIVCNRVPFPLKDGGALAMFAMINGWHELGWQVNVLAMNTSRHSVSAEQLPELFRQIESFEMVDVDTEIRLIPTLKNFIFSKKPQHAERFYFKHFEERLIRKIEEIDPRIIQLESIYMQEYSPAIRNYSEAFLIQRLHNIESELWCRLADETNSIFKQFYLRNLSKRIGKYEKSVWDNCDALIAITNADEAYIRNTGCNTKMCVIPFGVELTNIQETEDIPRWETYHIGAMDWQPNIEAMEWMRDEIVPAILKQTPKFSFQFAGRNMPDAFKQNKEESFFCAGEVKDAAAFMEDKKVLIVPLRSGSGIRIKTLEAMAAAKIVISTSVGIQGIEALDKVHFLKADTAAEFASAIDWCMHNRQAALAIAANAQQLIRKEYNQADLMKRLTDFVEKLS
jgi:glycosyltransferase involved in cell wall biosynthesis